MDYSYDYFHVKISQIASNTFATQGFVTDHLNHKTVNKTSSANPRQLHAH